METEKNFKYFTRVPLPVYQTLCARLAEDPRKALHRDRYLVVLDTVTSHLCGRYREIRRTTRDSRDWFTNLSSTLLHQMVGNCYNEIVNDLIAWGLIWRGTKYIVGSADVPGKCKAFSFRGEYSSYLYRYLVSREEVAADPSGTMAKFGRLQKVRVADRLLLKRLLKYRADVKTSQMADDMVRICHEQLAEHFRIDERKAADTLGALVSEGGMTVARANKELDKVRRFNSVGTDSVALYVKKDPYGRIHTNMTNIKKELRRDCLLCDGKPVTGVDIKSSQGAFLCAILGRFAGEGSLCATSDQYLDRVVQSCRWMDRVRLRAEYDRYRKLLDDHTLYEFFAAELSEDLDIDREVGRKEAKKEFLAMLFAPVFIDWHAHPVRAGVRRVWEEHFPCLLGCIDAMKRESYASLAHLMQRIESSFVFERVVPAVMEEVGCPFCTVHDSLVVPEEYAHAVKAIMDRELATCGIPTATEEEYAVAYPPDRVRRFYAFISSELYGGSGPGDLYGAEGDAV